jgi:hypothetical protein
MNTIIYYILGLKQYFIILYLDRYLFERMRKEIANKNIYLHNIYNFELSNIFYLSIKMKTLPKLILKKRKVLNFQWLNFKNKIYVLVILYILYVYVYYQPCYVFTDHKFNIKIKSTRTLSRIHLQTTMIGCNQYTIWT